VSAPAKRPAASVPAEPEAETSEWKTLVVAVLAALAIRTFVFQSFYVPSESMLPTLLVGDHVFVSKLAYGVDVPFTPFRVPGYREPHRGDVAVFQLARDGRAIYAPDLRPELPTEAFIKRMVGLPGETVEVRAGIVYIDGAASPQERTGETFRDPQGRIYDVIEETLGGCRHQILDDPRIPQIEIPAQKIATGRYFFLGDNRDNSYDSRIWGSVKLDAIEGPAGFLYWSWDFVGSWLSLLNPLTWIDNLATKTRWDRLGSMVRCQPPREGPSTH
jgi:signal peptidase I